MCNGNQRSLRLSFFCMNNPHTLPSETSVVEYPMCTYNIEMQTQFACPISCGEYNRKLMKLCDSLHFMFVSLYTSTTFERALAAYFAKREKLF